MKRLLAKKGPLIPSDLWQEIEKLKERNRQLRLKIGEERRSSIEKISELENQLAAEKTRWDELREELEDAETIRGEVRSQLEKEQADRAQLQAELERTREELTSKSEELEKLKRNPAAAIDLSGKAGELVNFFRTLLPKDTKLPKNTMAKLREILEPTED